MRRARRTDSNQPEIVKLLRKAGCIVEVTSDVGRGFPDLVVKTPHASVYLVEVKDGSLPPSRQQLTDDEMAVAARWGHAYKVVRSQEDAALLARL